jgi:hypothetical protein
MAEQMKQGNDVLLVDYEDDPSAHVGRLRQIGVDDETIRKHFIYVQPTEKWDTTAERTLGAGLEHRKISVAVVDSFGEALSVDGLSSNADEEVARWMRGSAEFLAGLGAAVILLDHVVKSTTSSRNSEFASGSQRKRASLGGAAYFIDVITAPCRDTDGVLRLIIRKDRFGWRRRDTVAAEILVANTANNGVNFVVRQPDDISMKPKVFRPTYYMERVSEYLQSAGKTMNKQEIVDGVGGKYKHVSDAIDRLVAEGYCSRAVGARRAQEISLVKPYESASDPKSGEPF